MPAATNNPTEQVVQAFAGASEPSNTPTSEPENKPIAGQGDEPENPAGTNDPTTPSNDAGGAPDLPQSPESEGEGEIEQKTVNFKDLAEQLGMDVKDLYAVEIGLGGDGSTTTLGELKDGFKDLKSINERQEALDAQKMQQENELLRARQELAGLVRMLPEVPANYLQQLQVQEQAHLNQERAALLEVMPEFKDPAQSQAITERISGIATEYGFSKAELAYVQDHRLIKLVNDFALLNEKFKNANAQAKQVASAPKKPSKQDGSKKQRRSQRQKDLVAQAKQGDRGAQQAALLNALSGG